MQYQRLVSQAQYVIRGRPFDFDQGMGDFMVGMFFPQTSGDRIFFPHMQSYCMEGISLQVFFVLKNLYHPPPPLKSQMVGPL